MLGQRHRPLHENFRYIKLKLFMSNNGTLCVMSTVETPPGPERVYIFIVLFFANKQYTVDRNYMRIYRKGNCNVYFKYAKLQSLHLELKCKK